MKENCKQKEEKIAEGILAVLQKSRYHKNQKGCKTEMFPNLTIWGEL